MTRCRQPLSTEELLAYQLRELDAHDEERVEEHYFSCHECSQRLETLMELGAGIRQAMLGGLVTASVTADLVERGIKRGLRVRSYRVAPGQSVSCTASPADDFVAIRLGLEAEVDQVDVAVRWTDLESGNTQDQTITEATLDHSTGEVLLLFSGREVRSFPRSRWQMEALVQDARGQRQVGPYTLEHTPWEQLHPSS